MVFTQMEHIPYGAAENVHACHDIEFNVGDTGMRLILVRWFDLRQDMGIIAIIVHIL
jgi:hypothetical protein